MTEPTAQEQQLLAQVGAELRSDLSSEHRENLLQSAHQHGLWDLNMLLAVDTDLLLALLPDPEEDPDASPPAIAAANPRGQFVDIIITGISRSEADQHTYEEWVSMPDKHHGWVLVHSGAWNHVVALDVEDTLRLFSHEGPAARRWLNYYFVHSLKNKALPTKMRARQTDFEPLVKAFPGLEPYIGSSMKWVSWISQATSSSVQAKGYRALSKPEPQWLESIDTGDWSLPHNIICLGQIPVFLQTNPIGALSTAGSSGNTAVTSTGAARVVARKLKSMPHDIMDVFALAAQQHMLQTRVCQPLFKLYSEEVGDDPAKKAAAPSRRASFLSSLQEFKVAPTMCPEITVNLKPFGEAFSAYLQNSDDPAAYSGTFLLSQTVSDTRHGNNAQLHHRDADSGRICYRPELPAGQNKDLRRLAEAGEPLPTVQGRQGSPSTSIATAAAGTNGQRGRHHRHTRSVQNPSSHSSSPGQARQRHRWQDNCRQQQRRQGRLRPVGPHPSTVPHPSTAWQRPTQQGPRWSTARRHVWRQVWRAGRARYQPPLAAGGAATARALGRAGRV